MDSLETNGTTAIEQTSQQPIVAETAPIEETAESTTVSTPQNKQEVLARAKEIVASENPIDKQEVEALKQGFYKFHNAEVAQARQQFVDEGGNSEDFVPELDATEPEFRALMQIIRDRRAKELEEVERQKQEGLARKLEILDRIQQLATTPEDAKKLGVEDKEVVSVKLDTNGYRPEILHNLMEENLIDYVAMDIKNTFEKYDYCNACLPYEGKGC